MDFVPYTVYCLEMVPLNIVNPVAIPILCCGVSVENYCVVDSAARSSPDQSLPANPPHPQSTIADPLVSSANERDCTSDLSRLHWSFMEELTAREMFSESR